MPAPLPRASILDTVRTALTVLVPTVAQGVIARRPALVAVAERLQADDRAVRTLQRLRATYGDGPLLLRVAGRSVALVLSPEDVGRVLTGSPEPFAPANLEKRGALEQFQPHGVLVSHGAERADRRRFNEAVLDTGRPVHGLGATVTGTARAESATVQRTSERTGGLIWDDFVAGWRRTVRRVVLGDAARDDQETTALLTRLRRDANWTYLRRPRRTALRNALRRRLQAHLNRAEPGSLAGQIAGTPTTPTTDPVDQVPQWLFAFDPAGMAAYRALGLIAAHPEIAGRVRAELAGRDLAEPQDLPLLRACVLESVRLWPTTALVLRDSTTETVWDQATMPSGTALMIVSAYFHRDDRTLPQADRFDPDAWLDRRARDTWSMFPFSGGPGVCPGKDLVLFTTSTFLAALLERHDLTVSSRPSLDPRRPLPRTLDPFGLRFRSAPAR